MPTQQEIDGVPSNFTPVDVNPTTPGNARAGQIPPPTKVPMPAMAVGSLPPSFQLQPDLTQFIYGGQIPTIRTFPVAPSGQAGINSAAKSIIIQEGSSSPALALQTNNIPNTVQTLLDLVQGNNIELTSDNTGKVTITGTAAATQYSLYDDFLSMNTTSVNQVGPTFGFGDHGWTSAGLAGAGGTMRIEGGSPGHLGSLTWANGSASQGAATTVYMGAAAANSTASAVWYPNAWALLETPPWTFTFQFKWDGAEVFNTFSIAHKSFYVGLAGPTFFATTLNGGGIADQARPCIFIGLRYDTSVSPGSIALTAAGNASGGNTSYTYSSTPGTEGAFYGQTFTVSGFVNAANNGTFTCVGSSNTALILNNPSGTSESHAATAVSGSTLNDSFFTLEATVNPVFAASLGRNNLQGSTYVTNVAPVAGVWHTLTINCKAVGVVTITLDGSATNTLTATIPQVTLTNGGTGTVVLSKDIAVITCAPGNGSTTTNQFPPFTGGSQITVSGLTGGNAPLNGTYTLSSQAVGAGPLPLLQYVVNHADIGSNTALATIVGYPALTPIMSFGNDDGGATQGSAQVWWDLVTMVEA